MVISSQILNMKMFNTLFVVMLIPHMLTTLSLPTLLDFPGTVLCRELMGVIQSLLLSTDFIFMTSMIGWNTLSQ